MRHVRVAAAVLTIAAAAGCGGNSGSVSSAASAAGDLVAYTACLRRNGLPDFPDPNPDGTLALPAGLDPSSQKLKDAEAKCLRYKPPGQPQQGGTGGTQGWSQSQKLAYAKCMRDNGATGFADPDANGDFSYRKGSGPDPDSPQYKAAEQACKQYKGQVPEGATVGGGA